MQDGGPVKLQHEKGVVAVRCRQAEVACRRVVPSAEH